jgi:hypothetical protein
MSDSRFPNHGRTILPERTGSNAQEVR